MAELFLVRKHHFASCVYVECKIFIREAGNKTPFSAKYIQTRVRRAPMQVCVTRRFSGLFLAPTGHTLIFYLRIQGTPPSTILETCDLFIKKQFSV